MKLFFPLVLLMTFLNLASQVNPVPFTPQNEREIGEKRKKEINENSLVKNLPFTNIGPTIMSGRVVDMEVNPADPTHFFVAYASGGIWETKNNGTTFTPVFDSMPTITIGDIACDWNTRTLYAGTGENNSSRSSYSGFGLYKSSDGGKTWGYSGLEETHHISRIVIHPKNPNVVWVATIGHLYSMNKERGVFKSADGGKTWKKTLFIDENTGVIDLVVDPSNPDVLYASAWYRTRRAWNFEEAGKTSGIYKSTDGGESWTLVSKEGSGFPNGEGVGRIGLAMTKAGKIYAFLDNQFPGKPKPKDTGAKLSKENFRTMNPADFAKLDNKDLETFLRKNDFPEKYSAEKVKKMVADGKIKPLALTEYLEDANSLLFDTEVTGAELYVSTDAGNSWKKTHEGSIDGMYYTYGYYFGNIRISEDNPGKIYLLGFVCLKSADGGKTFTSLTTDNTHVDYHALWVNPNKSGHLICGNDGGLNISYDDGENWIKCNSIPVGQFYAVNYDYAKPYSVYGGLQDNGVWVGPSGYKFSTAWHQEGEYPYKNIMGGDGMQVMIDPRDNNTVYTGFQFGNYFRIDKTSGKTDYISPKHDLGERPLRFNWQTPIWLSVHNPDILYLGSNRFHRSFNKGEEFQALSGDLTQGGKKGDVSYGTLTTIHESPLRFGLIYTGSDDGLIHVSMDGGYTWKKIGQSLPQNYWVSRVWASAHQESRVYVSLNGYRWDNFQALVYVSEDYGNTWKSVTSNLPLEPVNVIKEDPINPNLLYVGTDNGLYVSLDRGKSYMGFGKQMPPVAVHDIAIHPRDKELIAGTHGRSIYKAKTDLLQEMVDSVLAKDLHAFKIPGTKHQSDWGKKRNAYTEPKKPEVKIPYYTKINTTLSWEVVNDSGLVVSSGTNTTVKGLNFLTYDLSVGDAFKSAYLEKMKIQKSPGEETSTVLYLLPGKYRVKLTDLASRKTEEQVLEINAPKH